MTTTTFLERDALWREITRRSALKSRGAAYVAVAYVQNSALELMALRDGDHLVADISREALQASQTNPDAIEAFLKRGVIVHSRPNLHAKVYVFGRAVIVGSANASDQSRNVLVEAGVSTTDPDVVAAAVAFVKESEVAHEQIDLHRIRELRPFYRSPDFGASRRVPGVLPPSNVSRHRVGVVGYETYLPTASETRVISATRARARRAAGAAADMVLESFTWRGPVGLSQRDFLIQVGGVGPESDWLAYPPAEVVNIETVSANRNILWLTRSRSLEPVPWLAFMESARRARSPLQGLSLQDISWLPLEAIDEIVAASWPQR